MGESDLTILVTFNGRLSKIFGRDKLHITLTGGVTIEEVLNLVCNSAERRERIFDVHGKIREDITVLKNGRNIVFINGTKTELHAGDTIALFPPVCGG